MSPKAGCKGYVNDVYGDMPQAAVVIPKAKGKLTVQMDELWSFVDHKGNKQWVWLAMDAETREIIGCYIGGKRSHAAGLSLTHISRRTMAIYSGLSPVRQRLYRSLGAAVRPRVALRR